QEMMMEHAEQWLVPLRALLDEDVATPLFHRGFVEELIVWGRLGAEAFVGHANELFQLAPLQVLRFYPVGGHDTMRALPWETRTKLITDRLGPAELKALVHLPQLKGLRVLDFSGTTMD